MPLRRPTSDELAHWDELVATDPAGGSMWQFDSYVEFKTDWKPVRAVHELSDGSCVYTTYLERRIPVLGPLWYASTGPRVKTVEQLREVCEQLQGLRSPFAVLMEPPIEVQNEEDQAAICQQIPRLHTAAPMQKVGIYTVEIDLTPSEDELLASFKQRTRRYLRKNANATIEIVTDDSRFDEFWDLYVAMLGRSHVKVREREYFETFWRHYLDRGQAYFVLGTPEGEDRPTAGAFCIINQDIALYKDGGSTRDRDSNGLQYLVQWECMREAKRRGARTYDMFGAPPTWRADDPTHGFHGLVQFKTGFAPITNYAGAFLLHTRPVRAALWEKGLYDAYIWQLWNLQHQYFI